jgi:D-glycero-D-manno-heptose 1,7-bisphosphate phosphatase
MSVPLTRYAFLDKDGTLVENVPYNVDPALMRLTPGAASLAALADDGFRFAVISNQPGVALRLFPERALRAVEDRLAELLGGLGVEIDDFLYCPHHPEGREPAYTMACACRKPEPGLLLRAADALGADLSRSWMVGDTLDDVEAGHRAGCRAALVNNGGETEWVLTSARRPDVIGRDLADVVEGMLAADDALAGSGSSTALAGRGSHGP